MAKKQIIIDVPKFPVVRSRFLDERHVALDLRGIRNPHKPMLGRLNPTKGVRPKFISVEQKAFVPSLFRSNNWKPRLENTGSLVMGSFLITRDNQSEKRTGHS